MTTSNYPRRRPVPRQRPWQAEVPDAFTVPDVPEVCGVAQPAASVGPGAVATGGGAATGGESVGETAVGSSHDRSVQAEVDLRGHLRNLRIDPSALRGPHPQRVGAAVVEAMSVARALAVRLSNERRRR